MTIHQTPGDRHRIPRNNIYAFKCTIKLNKPHTWCWFDKNKESNQTNAIEIKFYFRLRWTHVGILTRMCDSRCFSLFLGICLYFQAFEKGFTTFRLSVGYYPWVTKYFFSDSFYSIPCCSCSFVCLSYAIVTMNPCYRIIVNCILTQWKLCFDIHKVRIQTRTRKKDANIRMCIKQLRNLFWKKKESKSNESRTIALAGIVCWIAMVSQFVFLST